MVFIDVFNVRMRVGNVANRPIYDALDGTRHCLQSAADQLRVGNTIDAYESMLRGRPNNLEHLGPSFSIKFLHAADAEAARPGGSERS